jgi:hypothetical protein
MRARLQIARLTETQSDLQRKLARAERSTNGGSKSEKSEKRAKGPDAEQLQLYREIVRCSVCHVRILRAVCVCGCVGVWGGGCWSVPRGVSPRVGVQDFPSHPYRQPPPPCQHTLRSLLAAGPAPRPLWWWLPCATPPPPGQDQELCHHQVLPRLLPGLRRRKPQDSQPQVPRVRPVLRGRRRSTVVPHVVSARPGRGDVSICPRLGAGSWRS